MAGHGVLEDLGNIRDFLGGIGVVATLAYLAVQIRKIFEAASASAGSRPEAGSHPKPGADEAAARPDASIG